MAFKFSDSALFQVETFPFPIRRRNVTVTFWLKTIADSGVCLLFESVDNTNLACSCLYESGHLTVNGLSSSAVSSGVWHHVAVHWSELKNNANGNFVYAWVDGVAVITSSDLWLGYTLPSNDLINMLVGWYTWTPNPASQFSFAAIKVFHGKLSVGEIRREASCTKPVYRERCFMSLPLDEARQPWVNGQWRSTIGHGKLKNIVSL